LADACTRLRIRRFVTREYADYEAVSELSEVG
jgi:hypothetical protein